MESPARSRGFLFPSGKGSGVLIETPANARLGSIFDLRDVRFACKRWGNRPAQLVDS
jgi:hypothetical protein